MPYPHSPSETIADGVVHATGLALALPAVAFLLLPWNASGPVAVAIAIYAVTLIASLTASAVYHMSPVTRTREALGRIDHAMIYFKIGGTYAPLVAVIGTGLAYSVALIVWILAIGGAVAKLRGWQAQARGSLALYLAMGWLSVLLFYGMWHHLPRAAVWLIVAGGSIYSLGTIIFAQSAMRYQNAIWHMFVLLASICFFCAINLSVR